MDFETLLREADPAREEEVPGCDSPVACATLSRCVASAPDLRRRPRARQATAAAATALRRVTGPRPISRPLLAGAALAATAAGIAAALVLSTLISPAAPGRQHPGVLPTARPQPGLTAVLTYDGLPADPGDAAAVLRQLADRAAAQPAQALGPVWYTKVAVWGPTWESDPGPPTTHADQAMWALARKSRKFRRQLEAQRSWLAHHARLFAPHYGLGYWGHILHIQQEWDGRHAFLSVTRFPGGRVPSGIIPVSRQAWKGTHAAWFARNPAALPASPRALWQRLLSFEPNHPGPGQPVYPPAARFLSSAWVLMASEPLPPAVRATILRLMSGVVAKPPANTSFIDLGAVTGPGGRRGIAIGDVHPEYQGERGYGKPGAPSSLTVDIYDPATGALIGTEFTSCKGPATAQNANAICAADAYVQYLQIKAAGSVPPAPSRGR